MGLRNGVRAALVGLSPGTHAVVGLFSFSVLYVKHMVIAVLICFLFSAGIKKS
jgi:hypothetical protein